MQCFALAVALLIGYSGAARLRLASKVKDTPHSRRSKTECWQKRPVFISKDVHVSKGNRTPGAGMSPESIVPFQTVLKDGYFSVDCVKDHMYYFGDKFGDNKYDYNQGKISNTSIVLYSSIVPKADRKPMSPAVCFEFCRTVPDMMFFGIANGQNCYCTPFFKAMEADNKPCDEMCPGSNTEVCGSKVKSTVFEMHLCQDAGEELRQSLNDVMEKLDVTVQLVNGNKMLIGPEEEVQSYATRLQKALGEAADPGASDLVQSFKVGIQELYSHWLEISPVMEKLTGMKADVDAATAASNAAPGSLPYDKVKELERTRDNLQKIAESDAAQGMENFPEKMAEVYPETLTISKYQGPYKTVQKLASMQYYPTMYFVNKTFMIEPSTCTGTIDGKPKVATQDGCASACDRAPNTCIGFQWMPIYNAGFAPEGLCFLFSKLKTIQHYTGCEQKKDEFGLKFMCMAKYSKFDGVSLVPDRKSDIALKEVSKADRCIKQPK
jgi:hypothetical protein